MESARTRPALRVALPSGMRAAKLEDSSPPEDGRKKGKNMSAMRQVAAAVDWGGWHEWGCGATRGQQAHRQMHRPCLTMGIWDELVARLPWGSLQHGPARGRHGSVAPPLVVPWATDKSTDPWLHGSTDPWLHGSTAPWLPWRGQNSQTPQSEARKSEHFGGREGPYAIVRC